MSRYFAKGREPMSSYTHFWGAVGGVIATFLLVGRSLWEGSTADWVLSADETTLTFTADGAAHTVPLD